MSSALRQETAWSPLAPEPHLILHGQWGIILIVPVSAETWRLRRFEVFPHAGSSSSRGQFEVKRALRDARRDPAVMHSVRAFYSRWQMGGGFSGADSPVIGRLERDIHGPSLATFYMPREALLHLTIIDPAAGRTVPAPVGNVAGWTVKQKITGMFEAIPDYLAGAAKAELQAFLTPANLAILVGSFVAIAAVQAVPGADAAVDVLLVGLAYAQFGWAGLLAVRDFIEAVTRAGRATSRDEIMLAAKLAAAAVVTLGVTLLFARLTRRIHEGNELPGKAPEEEPAQKSVSKSAKRTRPCGQLFEP